MITKQNVWGISVAAIATMASVAAPSAWAKNELEQVDRTFLHTASRANIAEIQTGKLALKKSNDPKVRMIAQTIVREHTDAENKLKTVAAKLGEPVPNTPDAKHQREYKKLASLSGRNFNKQYLAAMMKDHHAAIKLFNTEMAKGKHSEVRSYAANVITGIYNHTKMIHNVAGGSYGIPTTKNKMTMQSDSSFGGVAYTSSNSMPEVSRMSSMAKPNPMVRMSMMSGKGNLRLRNTKTDIATPKGNSFTPAPRSSPIPTEKPVPGLD